VPPNVLGQLVEIRRAVDAPSFEVRWAGTEVAHHTIAPAGVAEVWADDHRQDSAAEALGRHDRRRCHLRAVDDPGERIGRGRLDLGPGDFDVDAPDLAARYTLDEGAGA
jgi:hypothetical protein